MKILILGGTIFVGRHLVEAALARGHQISLFHRGQRGADLFPDVEKLHGDRDGGLDALAGRSWDAVVDTCGYVPRIVKLSVERLADKAGQYVFVSSINAYKDFSLPGMDETAPEAAMPDETVEEVTGETYGPLKVLCEKAVKSALPGCALILRPGLIVGPYDPTGRFTYWPRRVAEGGAVLAPGSPEKRVQFIDARDLAEWTVRMVEEKHSGTFNAVCDDPGLTMGRLLTESRAGSGSEARFVWTDDAFLLGEGVAPWADLPLWLPEAGDYAGGVSISAAKAVNAGLTFRTLAATVRDTLAWDNSLPPESRPQAGISRERERELLKKYSENFTSP